MEYPTLVYRCPGTHQCPGGTFDYRGVGSDEQLTQLIKDGWYPTLLFAQDPANFDLETFLGSDGQPEEAPEEALKIASLSREELETKAVELGIRFSNRTTDQALEEKIAAITEA